MIRLNKNDWRDFMKKLLIVVDYQKDFVNGSLGFKEAEYLDEYLASLIDQYHQNKDRNTNSKLCIHKITPYFYLIRSAPGQECFFVLIIINQQPIFV